MYLAVKEDTTTDQRVEKARRTATMAPDSSPGAREEAHER